MQASKNMLIQPVKNTTCKQKNDKYHTLMIHKHLSKDACFVYDNSQPII